MAKTPITYYGGKQQLLPIILPLIPNHTTYTESFIGGGAVFWEKEPSKLEVINDVNAQLVTFYRVVKNDFKALEARVKTTLHSRRAHREAFVIYQNPSMFSEVDVAWSVWVLSSQGFAGQLDASWGYDKSKNTMNKRLTNKKAKFTNQLAERLEQVTVECTDACKVIKIFDSKDTFHYVDPPYFNSNCGHYDNYSEADFRALLELLGSVKGKFLLSSYPSKILDEYRTRNGWYSFEVRKKLAVSSGAKGTKVEVFTANYPISLAK